LVIGRSDASFAKEPTRLRMTEGAVIVAASLAVGGLDVWDFLIATRLMTRAAAAEFVQHCREQTIGNDVAWPLHVRASGMQIQFRPVDGLAYRHRNDFCADRDDRDAEPLEWVRRIQIAAQHAAAIREYVDSYRESGRVLMATDMDHPHSTQNLGSWGIAVIQAPRSGGVARGLLEHWQR
jgi:hypothetical protein